MLTAGDIADVSIARALVERTGPIGRLMADRGYGANHRRRLLADRGTGAVIRDHVACHRQDQLERLWCPLKG